MKKVRLLALLIAVGLISFNLASDYYRYDLYRMAISFEASHANFTEKEISLDGKSFSYLENNREGKQGTILMLHGFSATKENWLRFSTPLADNYHLIALDLMGHGNSYADLNQSYSVENQVEFVRQFTNKLSIQKLHLVGNSMGGAISSLYAANFPDSVESITLISPAGVHDIPSLMDELLDQGVNPLIAKTTAEFEDVMAFVMEDQPYIPTAITKVEAEKAAKRIAINEKIFKDIRGDMHKGLDARFKDIKAPTLIIWGKQDRVINVKNIDKYARLIPDAEKLILEDVGHLAMLEAPKISAQALEKLIN